VIDAASNSFRVRLELPNPENALPPGLRCKVEFDGLNAAEGSAMKPMPEPGPVPAKPDNAAGKPAMAPGAIKPPAEKAGVKPQGKQSVAAAPHK
jgi:hypothetical protein